MICIVFTGLYMFYYRYQCLSSACPDFGMAWVRYLSTACPKIEQLDPAPFERIVRGLVSDITPMIELLDATVIGGLGAYFGISHYFCPIDVKAVLEETVVP